MAAEAHFSVLLFILEATIKKYKHRYPPMKAAFERLERKLRGMQSIVQNEEQRQTSDGTVSKSVAEILKLTYELEDIADTSSLEVILPRKTSWLHRIHLVSVIIEQRNRRQTLAGKMEELLESISGFGFISAESLLKLDAPESISSLRSWDWEQIDPDLTESGFSIFYLAMFPNPKEMDIPVRRLIHLWIAELDRFSEEDVAREYVRFLERKGLVTITRTRSDGSAKRLRINPGLYSFVHKAEELGYLYIHKARSSSADRHQGRPSFAVRRLVEFADIKDYPDDDFHVGHLRSYMSFNFQKKDRQAAQVGNFLSKVIAATRGYSLLAVLDLEGIYKPALPEDLGSLCLLKYLGLRWTFLDALPSSISNLSRLQTLDVKHTYIRSLPPSFQRMRDLRHLYLNGIPLDMDVTPISDGIQTLSGLFVNRGGFRNLLKLSKLSLTCCLPSSTRELSQWISRLDKLQSLKLRSKDDRDFGKPSSLDLDSLVHLEHLKRLYLMGQLPKLEKGRFPCYLTELTLSFSKFEEDPMPILGRDLPKLTVLKLLASSYIGHKMSCERDGFCSLRILQLWVLENLEELKVEEGAMEKLQELEIRRCRKLETIPKTLVNSNTLKELTLTSMPEEFVAKIQGQKTNEIVGWKLKIIR